MIQDDRFPAALSRIARIVSETLELKEVFAQVADAVAEVLPFETMGVCRLEFPDHLRLYAVAGNRAEEDPDCGASIDDFSPAMRPRPGATSCFNDAAKDLDPAFAMDRDILASGVRSMLCSPLMSGGRLAGEVWFTSTKPNQFTPQHEKAAAAIADILSLSLEHERLWKLEESRRRRLDAIDSLLPMIAGTLDVRGIFHLVSEVVQPVLAHDRLVLSSLSADQREITIDASTGEPLVGFPARLPVSESAGLPGVREHVLIADVEGEPGSSADVRARCKRMGVRSLLKLPLQLEGSVSWLAFLSHTPNRYSEEDVLVGRRVADHVALALSHQRLAEEERRAAQEHERATRLEGRVAVLKDQLESTLGYRRVVGESKRWKDVLQQAAKVAPTETTVLLTGESGTGKEVVARFIQRGSPRADGPFVALNCAALPEALLESELFGHEKGAFTGALSARPGRIEQAAGGVLFLDEVAEMTPTVQAKLLRVLQEREYQRLGGTRSLRADVRIVAATNQELDVAIERGFFREDLYYRLRVFEIRLPALRDRRQDIVPMAQAFLEEVGAAVGRKAAGISRAAYEAVLAYHWPGNVRELRNAIERATILCDGGMIGPEHLPIPAGAYTASASPAAAEQMLPAGGVKLEIVERDLVLKALEQSRYNRTRAARMLGISRSQLYTRIQKHGLDS